MPFIEEIESQVLRDIYHYWERKRDGRKLPSRGDIDPVEIGCLLPNIFLVDVEDRTRRLKIRLMGTEFAEQYGEDITGRYLDEMDFGDAKDFILASYEQVLSTREPVRTVGQYTKADGRLMRFERIALPLSSDGADVTMILGGISQRNMNR